MKQLLSRKFILSVLVLIMMFVLVLLNKVNADTFVWIAVAVAGIYSTANIVNKKVVGQG